MKKDKIKNLIFIVILCLVTSSLTAYSVSSTFDSSNVCYQVDSNTQASVQDTIDDLYDRASDYSSLSSRIGNLEGYFQNNPTSYFNGNGLRIGVNAPNDTQATINLYYNGVNRGTLASSSDGITLGGRDSSGTWSQGKLSLHGNPVQINGKVPMVMITGFSTTDGRYYTRQINISYNTRIPFIILRSSQATANAPVWAVYNNANDDIFFSSTTASYNKTTHTLTIDNGVSAWAYPYIIAPDGLFH